MKFVTHVFFLGDTIHGIIRKYNKKNLPKEHVLELMNDFNEKNGKKVPKVGEVFEIPQWEEHEIPKDVVPVAIEEAVVIEEVDEPEEEPKIVIVQSKAEGDMFLRQERRENARREKEGKKRRPSSVIHIAGTKLKPVTSKATPTPNPPEVVNTNGLPARDMTEEEQEVLHNTLLNSVEIVHEGDLVEIATKDLPPVETPLEVVDNTPTEPEPTPAEKIAKMRKKARKRRQEQLNKRL